MLTVSTSYVYNQGRKEVFVMIDRFERFSFAISEISHYWHKIATDEMAKYGLKGAHALYLTAMHRHPEGITSARLCEECGKDKADVSRCVSVMEKKGLVVREDVNNNHYRALLKLTEKGKNAALQVGERARLAVEIGGNGVSDENRKVLYDALTLIAANLQAASEEGLPK